MGQLTFVHSSTTACADCLSVRSRWVAILAESESIVNRSMSQSIKQSTFNQSSVTDGLAPHPPRPGGVVDQHVLAGWGCLRRLRESTVNQSINL